MNSLVSSRGKKDLLYSDISLIGAKELFNRGLTRPRQKIILLEVWGLFHLLSFVISARLDSTSNILIGCTFCQSWLSITLQRGCQSKAAASFGLSTSCVTCPNFSGVSEEFNRVLTLRRWLIKNKKKIKNPFHY